MVTHPSLSKTDNYELLRLVLKERYGDSLPVDIDEAEITQAKSGRLSFAFHVGGEIFVKIVKPGRVEDRIPLSMIAAGEATLHAIPHPPPYPGEDGKLYQTVPDNDERLKAEGLDIVGQNMLVLGHIDIDEVPAELKNDPRLFTALGRYGAEFVNRLQHLKAEEISKQDPSIDTTDPYGFAAIRRLFAHDFDIDEEWTYLKEGDEEKIQDHVRSLLENLGQSVEAIDFAEGLDRGDLIEILKEFNRLEETLSEYNFRETLINGEIKPENIGAKRDSKSGKWTITSSFDYDQVGFGAAVKDLGRTISFFAFDKGTGEFAPDKAKEVIKGWIERRELSGKEKEALADYIKLGALVSYPVRSSYLADELQDVPNKAELDRLDPSIHLKQIRSLDSWLQNNDLVAEITELEKDTKTKAHQALSNTVAKFMKNSHYVELRNIDGGLAAYFNAAEAAHTVITVGEAAKEILSTKLDEAKALVQGKGQVTNLLVESLDALAKIGTGRNR